VALPPGWPREVPHPTHDAFVERAVLWLLDQGPSVLRDEPALRQNPIVLARIVAHHLDASLEGARVAYSALRRELPDLAASTIDMALTSIQREGARLQATRRELALVEEALGGAGEIG